jgi:tetratricopeptide (TPR) repeat protein
MGTERESFAQECALLRYNLGYFFFREKDYKRAAEEFERSVKLNPKNMDAYYNLGIIYDEYLNKDAEAIANYKKYLVLLGEQGSPKGKEDQQKATDLKNKVQNKLLQAELREKGKIDSPIDQTLR